MKLIAACIGLLLIGCGPPLPQDNRNCSPPQGEYLLHYVEQIGGTCMGIPDNVIDINKFLLPNCDIKSVLINDVCQYKIDAANCHSSSVTYSFSETINWNVDYSSATGYAQLSETDGKLSCQANYTFTLTKI